MPREDNQMKSLTLHTAETTDMSTQKCTHIKADAAVLTGRHREPSQHRGPVAFPNYFLLVGPSLFLSEWGSGSKSSLCVMRSLSEGNTIRVKRGRKGGLGEDRREKVCIVRGKGGKQQGAGQERNKNRPLTLSAVTLSAASMRGEHSQGRFVRNQNPVSGLVLKFHPALVQQVASVSGSAVAACFL